MEFIPPIASRDTVELIVMSTSTLKDYQQEAINQAIAELKKRNISQEEIESTSVQLKKEYEEYLDQEKIKKATEDYNTVDKILIVLFWYKCILSDWSLKKEGYFIKAESRIKCILIGLALYSLFIIYGYLSIK
jgi:hypothetical protein